ncbi:MAG: hypothetical protein M3N21_00680 [Actinomycetota bacterium]|nr:hypothetical protein [Actinomycetota bacterium]
MSDHAEHGKDFYNETWELIDLPTRRPDQDRLMLATALASRRHWEEAGGMLERVVGDWQVAHVASLTGHASLALEFAQAAVARAETADLPTWVVASAYEGLARAHATAGDGKARDLAAARCRELLEAVEDEEDRQLVAGQLAAVPGLPG